MKIDKSVVLEFIKSKGDASKAGDAESELPDEVDTDQHAGLLEKFGVDPSQLGGLGGVAGKLGGLGL